MSINFEVKSVDFEKDVLPLKGLMDKIAIGQLGDYDTAQDVVQTVMIKLWEKREELGDVVSLKNYVSAAVRNQCIDEIRKSKREQSDELDETIKATIPLKPSLMDNYLSTLNEYDRSIIVMKYEEGLTFREIGDILGCEGRKIQDRHYKIIEKFKKLSMN